MWKTLKINVRNFMNENMQQFKEQSFGGFS